MDLGLFKAERIAALRRGERWWPAELASRLAGLAALALCARVILAERTSAMAPPFHPAHALDLLRCALALGLLVMANLLLFAGPALLREVPWPGHFKNPRRPAAPCRDGIALDRMRDKALDKAPGTGAQAAA